jgi:chromosomal replication initiator protein
MTSLAQAVLRAKWAKSMGIPFKKFIELKQDTLQAEENKRQLVEIISRSPAPLLDPIHPHVPPMRAIQIATAQVYGLEVTDLASHVRQIKIARARHVAMYMCRHMTRNSMPEIGRRFGNRDHTTVLYAIRKIGRLYQDDPDLRETVETIRKMISDRK